MSEEHNKLYYEQGRNGYTMSDTINPNMNDIKRKVSPVPKEQTTSVSLGKVNPKMKLSKEDLMKHDPLFDKELKEKVKENYTGTINHHRIVRDGFELKEEVVEDRKAIPVFSGVLAYFPDALKEVSKASYAATKQHHPDKDMFWDRTKSTDNEDALVRHLIDHTNNPVDTDGVLHLAKVAWRSLAALQIYLESK